MAPMSQKIGKKMPTRNITQWPLRMDTIPSVIMSTR